MFYYGKTDTGKKRSSNQDAFETVRLAPDMLLCVICDGMGGVKGGNIASQTAIKAFSDYIKTAVSAYSALNRGADMPQTPEAPQNKTPEQDHNASDIDMNYRSLLQNAAEAANAAGLSAAKADSALNGMGTTLVAVLIAGKTLYAANVGDSRLYILENGVLTQITRDHSYVQYLVDIGIITAAEAVVSPYRNVITRAVGREDKLETDVFTVILPDGPSETGNYMVLCSDGLYNFVSGDKIIQIVLDSDGDDAEAALARKADELINCANQNGGGDNITVVLIKG